MPTQSQDFGVGGEAASINRGTLDTLLELKEMSRHELKQLNLSTDHPKTWQAQLPHHPIVAVIRTIEFALGVKMAAAVVRGGICSIEIAWTGPESARLIAHLREQYSQDSHIWVGAGTIVTSTQLQTVLTAGAQFCFSPGTLPQLIDLALSQGIPFVPGALTPTEIMTAWQLGVPCVKVFPIGAVGGASYLRALQGPLGAIPLIPSGGVNADNGRSLLQAGAIALGLSSSLFPREAVAAEAWDQVEAQAKQLVQVLS